MCIYLQYNSSSLNTSRKNIFLKKTSWVLASLKTDEGHIPVCFSRHQCYHHIIQVVRIYRYIIIIYSGIYTAVWWKRANMLAGFTLHGRGIYRFSQNAINEGKKGFINYQKASPLSRDKNLAKIKASTAGGGTGGEKKYCCCWCPPVCVTSSWRVYIPTAVQVYDICTHAFFLLRERPPLKKELRPEYNTKYIYIYTSTTAIYDSTTTFEFALRTTAVFFVFFSPLYLWVRPVLRCGECVLLSSH